MDDAMRVALWEITTQARVGRPGSSPTRSKWVTIPAHVYHKAVAVLAAAPAQPSQAGLPDREVIARVVDPKAWVQRQRHLDQAEACEYPDHAEQWIVRADDVVRPSLDIAAVILASIRSSVEEGWQTIETAPYNETVEVRVGHMAIEAVLRPEASMSSEEVSCDQWQAAHEGEHPPCWSEGACWSSNVDEVASLQPTAWRYPATLSAIRGGPHADASKGEK